jgi:hypothetical protein
MPELSSEIIKTCIRAGSVVSGSTQFPPPALLPLLLALTPMPPPPLTTGPPTAALPESMPLQKTQPMRTCQWHNC